MPRLSLWDNGRRSADYQYMDQAISEFFGVGGTSVFVHLYMGPYQQNYAMPGIDGSVTPAYDPGQPESAGVNTIQDVLFLENRDRRYSKVVYELRGVYNLSDLDYDLRQFGMFLQTDTIFIEFHYNDMMATLGRRIMPGDVLELPHRRDDTLNVDGPAINRFYVVEDAMRAATGYSATWYPHIWRLKASPMTASQEFQDILDMQATDPLGFDKGKIGDLMSTIANSLNINEAVVDAAKENVKARYFETKQFYMVTPEGTSEGSYPWVFAGDGVPPNGAVLLDSGGNFPKEPNEGDYFLRTDYKPATLFQYLSKAWRMQEQDIRRRDWNAAHDLLLDFINNTNMSVFEDGTIAPERVALSKAVKPQADF